MTKFARFDCRGVDIDQFFPSPNFTASDMKGENTFEEIDLREGDWAGYDEENDCSIGVYEFKSQIVKSKN